MPCVVQCLRPVALRPFQTLGMDVSDGLRQFENVIGNGHDYRVECGRGVALIMW